MPSPAAGMMVPSSRSSMLELSSAEASARPRNFSSTGVKTVSSLGMRVEAPAGHEEEEEG